MHEIIYKNLSTAPIILPLAPSYVMIVGMTDCAMRSNEEADGTTTVKPNLVRDNESSGWHLEPPNYSVAVSCTPSRL